MTHDYEFDFPVNLCRAPFARPGIYHFFSTNVLLCSIFLHIKARKLWQNKFRDKTAWITDLTTKRHKLQSNPINCTHCLSFLSCGDIENFSTWRNFQFPHNCHTWKAEISPHDNSSQLMILVILVTNIRSAFRNSCDV